MSIAYWLSLAWLAGTGVTSNARLALYVLCLFGSVGVRQTWATQLSPRVWLYLAACAVLAAAFFAGANFGLDALHGANRPKPVSVTDWGGIELWFVLCPGLAAVLIGGAAASIFDKRF